MHSGKPTASAVNERIASAPRRCTSATQKPASGPNSGPTTIAPTIRIGRVLVDADRREQAGEHHEGEEHAGELDVLARARLDLLPDDRVGGRAGRVLDRPLGVLGDLRVDRLDRDRALVVDAEVLEVGDDHARVLARDVGEDHVALRAPGGAREVDDVADRVRALEQLERPLGLVRLDDDPEVDHGAEATRRRPGSCVRRLSPRRTPRAPRPRVREVGEHAVDAERVEQLVLGLRVAVVVGGEPARLVAERPRVDLQPALVGAADRATSGSRSRGRARRRRRRRSRRRRRRRRRRRCPSSGRCRASRARRCRRSVAISSRPAFVAK